MTKTILIAGAAGALALAGIAIAQTPDTSYQDQGQTGAAARTTDSSVNAPSADTAATDTAAETDYAAAGERG